MSDENKDVVRRLMAAMNDRDMATIDSLLSPDAIEHQVMPGIATDNARESMHHFMEAFTAAFPDMHMEIDQLIAAGDKVVVRSTTTGTHQGEFMGMPATGKTFKIDGIDIVRVNDGLCQEHWGVVDAMAMMQQLGAAPSA